MAPSHSGSGANLSVDVSRAACAGKATGQTSSPVPVDRTPSRLFFLQLPNMEDVPRTRLGGELRGTVLARWGEANREYSLLHLVDSKRRLPFERPFGVHRIN